MESASSKISLLYHNIFNFPLTPDELLRWSTGPKVKIKNQQEKIKIKNNYIFLNGRQNLIKKRLQNEKYSKVKLIIAKKVAKLISKIPTVVFIGITGALAMNNAGKNSDIDLMIITKENTLWTTRFLVYGLLRVTGYGLRVPNKKNEKDKLCLNMWLDESDLVWDKKDRNIYTAHEIAQIVPLVNKDKIYEKFIWLNRWILNYWPKAVKVIRYKDIRLIVPKKKNFIILSLYYFISILEKVAFKIQYLYMRSKITREQVTPTRAIFHPNDWGKVVLKKLKVTYNNLY